MSRSWELFLRDMLEAARKVIRYAGDRQVEAPRSPTLPPFSASSPRAALRQFPAACRPSLGSGWRAWRRLSDKRPADPKERAGLTMSMRSGAGGAMRYTVILEQGRERGFVVVCPALPGCVSQGETRDDALDNIREAIEVYVEALIEDGLPIPTEIGRETVEIEVAAR